MPTHRHSKRPRPLNTLSPAQASEFLRMKPNALARHARMGIMGSVKVGRMNMYPADEVRRLIMESNTQSVAEKLIQRLEYVVAQNNKKIKQEATNGKRKD